MLSYGRLTERLIDGRALLAERARAILRDVEAVFQANAELAIDGDHGLIADTHSGLEARLVSAHQVSPLVAVKPDTVAGTVGQAGHLVIRAETKSGDHFERGRIH